MTTATTRTGGPSREADALLTALAPAFTGPDGRPVRVERVHLGGCDRPVETLTSGVHDDDVALISVHHTDDPDIADFRGSTLGE